MICNAWPRVVQIRDHYGRTFLRCILCDNEMEQDRLLACVKILLETAEKTREGARGLVSAVGNHLQGVDPGSERIDDLKEITAIHVVTTHQRKPYVFLPLLLKAWPEALLHCRDVDYDGQGVPLHNVARFTTENGTDDHITRMRSIEAIVRGSTIEALAFAFLYVDLYSDLGFDLVQRCIEEADTDGSDLALRAHIQRILRDLVRKKDVEGRTLLHYVAAGSIEVPAKEAIRVERELLRAMGRTEDDFRDKSDEECHAVASKMEELRIRNLQNVRKICQWVLGVDTAAAFVEDCHGMNPFHFAISKGRQWNPELGCLASLVPAWTSVVDNDGLLPFMLAGAKGDVETSFELLRRTDTGSLCSYILEDTILSRSIVCA